MYDKFKTVYYYDILEGLTRSLFQQLITDARFNKLEEDNKAFYSKLSNQQN